MEFDDYIFHRNQVIDPDRRYATYRHVGNRLWERFSIPKREFNLPIWQELSYQCAIRNLPLLHKGDEASFFGSMYYGHRVIWVYSRERRCVATAMRPADVEDKLLRLEAQREIARIREEDRHRAY